MFHWATRHGMGSVRRDEGFRTPAFGVRWAAGALSVCLFAGTAGCDPPHLTETGVTAVFGSAGLGPGSFSYPRAIAAAGDGCVFIVDKSARVQRFGADGAFEHLWKMPFKQAGKPVGLCVSPDGRVFVADTHYHRVIVYDRDGQELARFGEEGEGDGQFLLPTDVALDAGGHVYVSEYNGHDRISKFTPDFAFVRSIGLGEYEGLPLRRPAAIDIDAAETLWVADACNHRVLRFDLDGKLLAIWGRMGREAGAMRYPYDITCTPQGEIMVCEYGNHRLQWFDPAGTSLRVWGGEGRRVGELWAPWGATYGANGLIYIVDSLNARVQIVEP